MVLPPVQCRASSQDCGRGVAMYDTNEIYAMTSDAWTTDELQESFGYVKEGDFLPQFKSKKPVRNPRTAGKAGQKVSQ